MLNHVKSWQETCFESRLSILSHLHQVLVQQLRRCIAYWPQWIPRKIHENSNRKPWCFGKSGGFLWFPADFPWNLFWDDPNPSKIGLESETIPFDVRVGFVKLHYLHYHNEIAISRQNMGWFLDGSFWPPSEKGYWCLKKSIGCLSHRKKLLTGGHDPK